MAKDVDFDEIEPQGLAFQGPRGGHQTPFVFEPTRRKMHVPEVPKSNPALVDGS